MNSEELELSLRSEFENYLQTYRAELRQEADELKKRLAEAFEAYTARFDSQQQLDAGFASMVTEHLRLARDEGSKLAAEAIAEAEQLENDKAAADYSSIRDAVADISSQTSQSAILKSLIDHAALFAPRGAFFIIKSEQFAGWKVFGESNDDESNVRDIHFPVSADTILGRAVGSMSTVDSAYGAHKDDQTFLEPLRLGQPDHMYAVPLVARGRGVAVLYADHGATDGKVNTEALETIVRIAALTVELLAASQSVQVAGHQEAAADFEATQHDAHAAVTPAAEYHYESAPEPQPATDFEFRETEPVENTFETAPQYEEEAAQQEVTPDNLTEPVNGEPSVTTQAEFDTPAEDAVIVEAGPDTESLPVDHGSSEVTTAEPPAATFETGPAPFEPAPEPEPATVGWGSVVPEPATAGFGSIEVAPAPPPARARLSERNVDLPIDVAEEERRLHNDARRFARLLVSEIKLYNEKKVMEGRQSNDLYERLREAIDRSREMYDKRVQPPVASKFDYFHYELVNALADGHPESLGTSYPGANI